jgi:hypothetical protein
MRMAFAAIDPVAIYAAVVSTIALGWQIQEERRFRRPQVAVQAGHAMLNFRAAGWCGRR